MIVGSKTTSNVNAPRFVVRPETSTSTVKLPPVSETVWSAGSIETTVGSAALERGRVRTTVRQMTAAKIASAEREMILRMDSLLPESR
jgi:hypothetical protein